MFKAALMVFLSSFLSSSSVTISSHLFRSVLATPIFCCNGWWESNVRYWVVCVFFRYTFTFTDPWLFSRAKCPGLGWRCHPIHSHLHVTVYCLIHLQYCGSSPKEASRCVGENLIRTLFYLCLC